MADEPDRRKFLKIATCGVGAGIGAAVVVPALSMLVDPARRRTVTTPTEPIDVGDPARLGADWQRVEVVAPQIRDAWTSAQNVVLGAAFLRKRDKVEALSAVCPHLGCTVGWQAEKKSFLCPCHDTRFAESGDLQSGPAERGLDPLPIEIREGRLQLTWIRYKLDIKGREPA